MAIVDDSLMIRCYVPICNLQPFPWKWTEKHQGGNMCNYTYKGYYEGIWYITYSKLTRPWLRSIPRSGLGAALCLSQERKRTRGVGRLETLTVKLWPKPRLCESDSNTLAKGTLGKCQHLSLWDLSTYIIAVPNLFLKSLVLGQLKSALRSYG